VVIKSKVLIDEALKDGIIVVGMGGMGSQSQGFNR